MTLKDSVQTAFLVVGFFTLIVFATSYYFILIDPDSSNLPLKESLSITASFFGGFATLTAAYIASRLFNDWRLEKDHDTKSIYLNNAIKNLLEIQSNLLNCKSNVKILKTINENLIIISKFIDDFSKSHENTLISISANLKVVEDLFDSSQFSEDLLIYEQHIKQFNEYSTLLSKRYKTYYYYYVNTYFRVKPSNDINVYRPFFPQRKLDLDVTHSINSSLVLDVINTQRVSIINENEEYIYYSEYIERCLDEHKKLFSSCTRALRAKN